MTTSSSHGAIGFLPLGLEVSYCLQCGAATHVKTTPRKRCPTLIAVQRPCLASFLPLHRRGSQWSKSHIATGTATRTSCSCSSPSSEPEPEPEPDSSSSDESSSSVVSLSSSSSDPDSQSASRDRKLTNDDRHGVVTGGAPRHTSSTSRRASSSSAAAGSTTSSSPSSRRGSCVLSLSGFSHDRSAGLFVERLEPLPLT